MLTQQNADEILSKIDVPYKASRISTLGGVDKASIILFFSLDSRDTWNNGIMENSRFFKLHYSCDGQLDLICQSHRFNKKFRKSRNNTTEKVIEKINKFIDSQKADSND